MIKNIQEYIEPYVSLDKPIPYKELQIYPIKVSEYNNFDSCKTIFLIDKNKIADIEVIQMTDIDYLVKKLFADETMSDNGLNVGSIYYIMFAHLIELCLHITMDNIDFIEINNHINLKLNNVVLNNEEYNDLRRLILYQNLINYDDTPMSDDVKEAIADYYRIVSKDIVPVTLEDMIDVVAVDTHYEIEYIHNLTYRRFNRLFERILSRLDYQVGSYGYTREKPPEHYIYKKHKEKYSDVFTDFNKFEKKFNGS